MADTKILFETIKVGSTTLTNRVGVAPMTRTSATPEGLATDQMVKYYTKFAQGGFGLVITEGIYPDGRYGQGYFNQPGIINDDQVQAWNKVVDSVHQAGSKMIAQLMHAGALSQGNRFNKETIGPSAVLPKGEQLSIYGGEGGAFKVPKAATKEDIADIIRGFADAATRAKEAGFDGVEIHGANGYILDQFLTDYMNVRTDEYGGSTENRVRILVEVIEAVRKAVGQDYTVGIRISQGKVNDFHHKWAGKEQDAEIIFSRVAAAGVDYIHVTEYKAWEPAFEGNPASLAALATKYGKLPVMANGYLDDPEKAAEMIRKGEADIVTIGRGALANGDWPNKVKNNEPLKEFEPEKVLSPTAIIKDFEEKL